MLDVGFLLNHELRGLQGMEGEGEGFSQKALDRRETMRQCQCRVK